MRWDPIRVEWVLDPPAIVTGIVLVALVWYVVRKMEGRDR